MIIMSQALTLFRCNMLLHGFRKFQKPAGGLNCLKDDAAAPDLSLSCFVDGPKSRYSTCRTEFLVDAFCEQHEKPLVA